MTISRNLRRRISAVTAALLLITMSPAAASAVAPTPTEVYGVWGTATSAPPADFVDTLVAAVPSPTGMAFTPDGRLLVSTQPGRLRVIVDGVLQATTALDLSARTCSNSERGMLGVAADPNPANSYIYVFYSAKGTNASCPNGVPSAGAPANRVSRFVLGANNIVDPASETILLDGIYSTAGNHNAGDLFVGKDGYLYVSTGDGGCDYVGNGCAGGNDAARDRNILNGKILRITTSGGVPTGNPFLGSGTASCRLAPVTAGTVCRETFATGLRNPFRMAADPNAGGTVFRINDVGQNVWEEINQGIAGADYGWNLREGFCVNGGSGSSCGATAPAAFTNPLAVYGRGAGCTSITGGAYVPNGIWPSAYTGAYLYADYVCNSIFTLSAGGTQTLFSNRSGSGPVDLEFGPFEQTQALYYAGSGQVRMIRYTGTVNRAPSAVLAATPQSGVAPLDVTLSGAGSTDPDNDPLTYTFSFGDGSPDTTTTTTSTTHRYPAGNWTATLTVTDDEGLTSPPATAAIQAGNSAPTATITAPVAGATFRVGQTYVLTGSGADAEDGALPASSLSWTILRRHEGHTHPFLGPVSGNNISFTAPGPEDLLAAGNSTLQIALTVTDSNGLTSTVTRPFDPELATIDLATSPAGLNVLVNGVSTATPARITSWVGFVVQVSVPEQTDGSGASLAFGSWSDGGARSHDISTAAGSSLLTATLATYFSDYPPGRQFFTEVQWLRGTGTASGFTDGTFRPSTVVDRQAMAAFLYRLQHDGEPAVCTSGPFTDVPVTNQFCGHIAGGKVSGVLQGFPDGTFRPTTSLARDAMAAFLYRTLNTGVPSPCTVAPFVDVPIGHPLCAQIAWLKAAGITQGYSDGRYRPSDPILRDALAAMLYRAFHDR